ncbi:MAG: UDP-N-acetylmuramoyl-L-alanyl-D-glutamate--2,6-diaminopimelate ligase [Actinomycetota bacterium]
MNVSKLVSAVAGSRVVGSGDIIFGDITFDSRAVRPGTVFFCVPGSRADGHDFAGRAVRDGAVALVVERDVNASVPQILVSSVRAAMGPMAAAFFGHPALDLTLIGITGTNGKTTTAYLLESVFGAMGMKAGLIGTVATHVGDEVRPGVRTTPEAADLQRLLAEMRDAGVRGVAMEASSEGLLALRVEGTVFTCSIFTNLSRDHLDTHGTMDAYFEAKAMLFRPEMSRRAVVNAEDPYARRLIARSAVPLVTFGWEDRVDVRALRIAMDRAGSLVEVDVAGARLHVRVPIPGRYNATNALGVLATAHAMEWPLDAVVGGIESFSGVPGRMERVEAGQDFTVLVDYAHTPESLEGVLRAAREFTPQGSSLILVFGCGGDRDRGKRPQMGRIGAELADRALITSDNPRSEDPAAIIRDIEVGARESGRVFVSILDRRDAIAEALRAAGPGDVVVVAGKGHETGQQFADRTLPFDDRIVVREILEELCSRSR